MNKLQIIVDNSFVTWNKNNKDLWINVFDRVFNKLVSQWHSLWKILPIYIEFDNRTILFGVVTLNEGWSFSFFPELPKHPDFFDHITFNKEITQNKHHYTRIANDRREKLLPIHIQHLSNGLYHAMTFTFSDKKLFKDAPKEIIYPAVDREKLQEIKKSFITSGKPEWSIILKIDDRNIESYMIQFFLIPKGVDYKNIDKPFMEIIKWFGFGFDHNYIKRVYCSVIPHEYNDNYCIWITIFSIERIKLPFSILTSRNKAWFYSKIDPKEWFYGKVDPEFIK